MSTPPPSFRRSLLVGLVLINVTMQLCSAWLLKLAPPFDAATLLPICLILGAVLALNVTRFVVWGFMHRRFPLSVAYPASALFFPGVLVMAWWFGETVGPAQVAGAALVLVGVALLLSDKDAAS